ncbi:MAG: SH3 domain-containing protein [Oscillospiraceae bacterium]|nr:SH3 domain-containing protein [Oscillospiraceae bacterium]
MKNTDYIEHENFRTIQHTKRRRARRIPRVLAAMACILLLALLCGMHAAAQDTYKNRSQASDNEISSQDIHPTLLTESSWSNKMTTSTGDLSEAVTTDKLNIRSGPGTQYRVICTVPCNTKLILTGKSNTGGTWVQVKMFEGKVGWCCRQYLSADASESDETAIPEGVSSAAVAISKLNLRSGPSTKYAIVCTVPSHTRLTLTGKSNTDGTWVQVEALNGKSGWCCQPYLQSDALDTAATNELTQAAYPLSIKVSLDDQKVTVLDAKGLAIKTFTCSSGQAGSETPTGTFSVLGRGISFYNSGLGEGAYYWTRFYGDYLFHSIPFDQHYEIEQNEAVKLGTPASHGCIRLSIDDAKWIYDHISDGTKVVIQ